MAEKEKEPTNQFDFKAVNHLKVYDKEGAERNFGSIYQDQRALVCFVRHFA